MVMGKRIGATNNPGVTGQWATVTLVERVITGNFLCPQWFLLWIAISAGCAATTLTPRGVV
jgi:hypothetical protein